ncbi:MAG: hypothetical protein LBT68_03970 [Spirochaetales bacterium]|jgi:hypothetical protein|nr:hypothetical protein [Spirochaetales bacterium]
MVDRVLIDTLSFKSRDFALKWKDLIRKTPQLKHYQTVDDESLKEMGAAFYPALARALERGLDRRLIGDFFVRLGKARMESGFPISEVIYAVSLIQKTVLEYLMTDFVLDSTIRMYQAMGVVTHISEFFLLGSFYLIKGFLEETYVHLNSKEDVSEDLLRKYFRDDFFFKKEE